MGIPWNPYQPTNVTQIARSEPRGLLNDSLGYAQQHPNEEGAEQCAVRSAQCGAEPFTGEVSEKMAFCF